MVIDIISGGGGLKAVLPLARTGRTISHARTPKTIYGCEINSPVLSASFPVSPLGPASSAARGCPCFLGWNTREWCSVSAIDGAQGMKKKIGE